jgi:hypothetical protein
MSHCQDEYGASGNLINDSIIAVNNTEETLKNRGTFVKIVMMGSGGLGGYFDARLAAVGADVHFVAPTPISTPCGRRA